MLRKWVELSIPRQRSLGSMYFPNTTVFDNYEGFFHTEATLLCFPPMDSELGGNIKSEKLY